MIFQGLASSSDGNAYLVDDGESRILLECGIPFSRLQKALGFRVSGLCACLVTHEHGDHSKGCGELLRRGVRIYASAGTCEALGNTNPEPLPGQKGAYQPFQTGTFRVLPFETFHGDVAEPVGYLVQSLTDGDKLVFAIDTVSIPHRFPGMNILAVECNHAIEKLERNTRLPASKVRRIANTHMEVNRLCDWLKGQDLSRCREIHLLHLSNANSNEGLFVDLVERVVPRHVRVTACGK